MELESEIKRRDMKMKKRVAIVVLCMMMALQVFPQKVFAEEVTYQSKEMVYASSGIGKVKEVKCNTTTINSINISWKQVSGVTGYEIYRSNAKDGTYKNVMNVAAGNGAFCNRQVKAGTEYYYKIRAYVKRGSKIATGKFSKVISANTRMSHAVKEKTKVNANVRKTAGISGAYVTTLKKGTKVSILCNTQDKTGVKWSKISYKHKGKKIKGYIRSDLLK